MKTIVALIIGLFSGFLIYMEAAMVFTDVNNPSSSPGGLFIFVTFIGGWALTTYIIRKNAKTVTKVISRGFLIGAIEWFAMLLVGVIFTGKAVAGSGAESTAEKAGAAIGGGLLAFLGTTVSIVMLILCLIGFVIFHLLGRELKTEEADNTKECPQCAELIKRGAKKCKHCGYMIKEIQVEAEVITPELTYEKLYYLYVDEQQTGPYSVDDLKSLGVTPKHYIWYEGLENWIEAGSLPDLKQIFN